MKDLKSPEEIMMQANAFRESRVLLSAVELKIFTALDHHMMTAEEVAQKTGADAKAAGRLMNALCGMGLIKKVKEKFYNTDLSSKYLVENKPEFMGNLYHTNHLWNTWSCLTDSVKKGSSVKGDQNREEKDKWVDAFIGAMHYRGVQQGRILAAMIDVSKVKSMLDVGGGSAAFSIEIVKRNPSIKATVLDLPHVIPLTKKYVEDAGLLNSFQFIEGNYLSKDFETGYDLILLSAVIHINSYEENKRLIQKCAGSLNEGGLIIISDFIMDDDRTKPYHGAMFSINMLVGTESGDTYTENEMREWLESAGLSDIEREKTSFTSELMIAVKK